MKPATPSRLRGRVQRLLHSARLVFKAGRQRLPAFLLSIGCLAVGAGSAAGQRQEVIQLPEARLRLELFKREILDQQFDLRLFGQDRTVDGAHARLESVLASQIEELDRVLQLSPAQKKKLELAGRGDIKRCFDRFESLKDKLQAPDRRNTQECLEEFSAFASSLNGGLFLERSLLHKSLPTTLTSAQFERYDMIVRENQHGRQSAAIKSLIAELAADSPFSDAKQEQFTTILTNEIKTARIVGPLDAFYFELQLCRIPEEKLKPLVDDLQWEHLNDIRLHGVGFAQILRKAGYFPDDDERAERVQMPFAPLKK
jgi:hypothetical protein